MHLRVEVHARGRAEECSLRILLFQKDDPEVIADYTQLRAPLEQMLEFDFFKRYDRLNAERLANGCPTDDPPRE